MVKWKLVRQLFGTEEFNLTEGEIITIGRGVINSIILSSLVISRQHCIIKIKNGKVSIKDLNSSNGTFIDGVKIAQNTYVLVSDQQLIGVGWNDGSSTGHVLDSDKFILKLIKENTITDRITFLNDIDEDFLESEIKINLKRPLSLIKSESDNDDVIDLCQSDNESEVPHAAAKRVKIETSDIEENVVNQHVGIEYEVFNVKQECHGYDEDPIYVDSDSSDSDTERRWIMRLSQGSPGGPHIKQEISKDNPEYLDQNQIIEPDQTIPDLDNISKDNPDYLDQNQIIEPDQTIPDLDNILLLDNEDDIISIPAKPYDPSEEFFQDKTADNVNVLEFNLEPFSKELLDENEKQKEQKKCNKPIVIEAQPLTSKRKSHIEDKKTSSKSFKHKSRKSRCKVNITNSQKEERKKKLKNIAIKEKETKDSSSASSTNNNKSKVNIKLTSSNRGAFLAEGIATVIPTKRNENQTKHNKNDSSKNYEKVKTKDTLCDAEKQITEKLIKNIDEPQKSSTNYDLKSNINELPIVNENKKPRESHKEMKLILDLPKIKINKYESGDIKKKVKIALKDLKPLTENVSSCSGKPVSKIEPLNTKKKQVRFSTEPPQIRVFEIEPGHKMKKTSLIKATLLDSIQMPVFSSDKIALMKILRWNPQWLDEQLTHNEPPPILGHNNAPMTVIHSFQSHMQYVQVIGDLILMEIWECITQAYMRKKNQDNQNNRAMFNLSIESLSPAPTAERCLEIFSLSVNISVLKSESKKVPCSGDLMLVMFGPDTARTSRFFYVQNVKCLPSPTNNAYLYYSITLHSVYTDKMKSLRRGEVMVGHSLAYIRNELTLFEAMEYMTRSPLSEAILRPDPKHYYKDTNIDAPHLKTKWTEKLNKSQLEAVATSVTAALSDKPSIQLVQGPPGTGKSGVICAIVMTYLQCLATVRPHNRGKILLCANSNAAVDELVVRLLEIRQSLPKNSRFRMVRVGRLDSMSSRARDLSSQSLAGRDVLRAAEPASDTHHQEISRLEAKINMWKSQAQESQDEGRIAYCQSQITELTYKIARLRSKLTGSAGEVSSDQMLQAERRIIEGADIIVATLASVANHKMRGLKRRIALCIVDEAGQSIEPETLLPLTLDVTRLTLVGDPQQLPGFICSQRAKQYGLGESLFSRVSSSMETWPGGGAVVLLDVQYRMHAAIADYPARVFYGGRLKSAPPKTPLLCKLPPYLMINISSGDKGQGAAGGNEMEAWGVARLVTALAETAQRAHLSLAVITPYNAHKDFIKKNLRLLQPHGGTSVEVTTVDSFQGQERDLIVVSLARSHGVGFLTDAGRMNVMLTRARHALYICLNMHAMTRNHQWRTLMDDAQKRKLVKFLPNKLCQPTTAAQLDNEEAIKFLMIEPNT